MKLDRSNGTSTVFPMAVDPPGETMVNVALPIPAALLTRPPPQMNPNSAPASPSANAPGSRTDITPTPRAERDFLKPNMAAPSSWG